MTPQDARQGGADWIEFGVIDAGLAVSGGVTGREQHLVSFPKGNLERFGEAHDHRPARDGPAAFDKADVPLGGCRASRKLKLADAAAVLTRYPVAIQLRYLQTMREIASERNTTSFFPIPLNLVELILKAIRTDRAT